MNIREFSPDQRWEVVVLVIKLYFFGWVFGINNLEISFSSRFYTAVLGRKHLT